MDHRQTIQDSLDYMEQNLKASVTPRELADRAGYSLFHFYRLFQSATGMSVMQYMLRRKLLHAIYEISQGSKRIDIVLQYGFETYSGFYKAFRREFGCTPSEYLIKHRARPPYRLDLYKEEHMEIAHKKAKEILKHWDLHRESLSDIYNENSGAKHENALYIGDCYILKYTQNLAKVQKSIDLANALPPLDLHTAAIVPTTEGKPYIQDGSLYFFLTQRLSGTPLSITDAYAEGKAFLIGQAIAKLHQGLSQIDSPVNEPDLLDSVQNWAMPKAADILNLSANFRKTYLDALVNLFPALPRQIIHRDPNPGNLILDGGKWGFIDFELSEKNIRIYDPCYAATAILSESFHSGSAESWLPIYEAILFGYDSIAHLSPEEKAAVPYILLANQLVCVAWFSEQEQYADIFETNKRMTNWLIAHFEELCLT